MEPRRADLWSSTSNIGWVGVIGKCRLIIGGGGGGGPVIIIITFVLADINLKNIFILK